MAWKTGAIIGELRLDTQQHDSSLRASVQATQSGAAQMKAALDKPFAPAVAEVKKLSSETSNATAGLGRYVDGLKKLQSFAGEFAVLPGILGNIAARTSALSGKLSVMIISLGSATAATGGASAAAGGLTAAAGLAAPAIAAIGIAAAAIVPPLIGLGIVKAALGSEFVQIAARAETTAVAFRVMTGSAATAGKLLGELKTFAASTPLNMPEITASAKQLLAMGGSAATVTNELRMLGDVGSMINSPLQEMAYLYGQIRSQQTAYTQDLNQFAGRGIPIYSELGKILGINAAGVKEMASQGQITFPLIEQAFVAMTSAGGQFHDGMKQMADTIAGLQSTMEDAWTTVKEAIGNALVEGFDLKEMVRQMTKLIEESGPMIVNLFRGAVEAGKPFVGIFVDVINFLNGVNAAMSAFGDWIDDVFGEGSGATIVKWVAYLNPVILTLKAISFVLSEIGKGLSAISWLWSDESTAQQIKNGQAISKSEMEKAIKEREAKRAENAPKPAAPVASPVEKAKANEKVKAEKEAAASADRTAEIQMQTRLAQMRAAGKEAEAAQLELWNKWEDKYNKATSAAEKAAINAAYAQERADLTAKQKADRDRAATEAEFKSRVAALKAAGKEVEADQLTRWQAMQDEMAGAKSDEERTQIVKRYWVDSEEIKKRGDADEAKKSQKKDELKSDMEAQLLAERGQAADAEMVRFEASWRKKIATAETAEEKITLAAIYESEKRQKQRDKEVDAAMAASDKLAGIAAGFSGLSGKDRAAAYGSLARASGSAGGVVRITQAASPLARQAIVAASPQSTAVPPAASPMTTDPRLVQMLTSIRDEVKVMHSTTLATIAKNTVPAKPVKVGM